MSFFTPLRSHRPGVLPGVGVDLCVCPGRTLGERFGSAAAAGLARLLLIIARFLAKRACARAAEPLSAGADVGR